MDVITLTQPFPAWRFIYCGVPLPDLRSRQDRLRMEESSFLLTLLMMLPWSITK